MNEKEAREFVETFNKAGHSAQMLDKFSTHPSHVGGRVYGVMVNIAEEEQEEIWETNRAQELAGQWGDGSGSGGQKEEKATAPSRTTPDRAQRTP